MGTILIRRQERRQPPPTPRGELLLESPPEIPEAQSGGFQAVLMYLPMAVMPVMMGLMFLGGGTRNPLMMISSGGMALAMGAMMVGQMGRGAGERKFKLNGARRDYYRYLGQARRRVRRAAEQQREALEWNSPHPESLWSLVMSARIWERRPHDQDFGNVRIGVGPQKLAVELVPPETKPIEDLEPMTAGALRRFVRAHSTVPNLPVAVSMPSFARIVPMGEPEPVRAMVRAMLAQMASFHSPDDLRISICASAEAMPHWDWVKWLPHAMHPAETDAAGPVRLMSTTLSGLEAVLGAEVKDRARFSPGLNGNDMPYHVVVVDGGSVTADSQIGADGIKNVCVIDLSGSVAPTADNTMLRLRVAADRMAMLRRDRTGKDVATALGRPDQMGIVQAEGLARQLAPLRASAASGEVEHDVLSSATTLTSLLGVDEPDRLDVAQVWRPRAPRNRLRVPIGVDTEGRPVDLDIKEAAQGGFGPHGLCIGATGSGKSELLRTLVLGLAMTHSSEVLNFVLVDFKGGATFLGMDGLQHVSAIITNLEDELPLVDRMYDALHGEMVRRQEWLRQAGNYASLRDYEKAREQGAPLRPMPTLFVVLDEFSELLSAKPDFIELFVMIGRLGRSLGVHLLLASQRLEEGKLRGLDTHLSYRIGLRTFSAMESRVVLGVPDAYELPQAPGNGYLKVGTETMVRFRAAYVSGAHKPQQQRADAGGPRLIPQIVQFGPAYVPPQIEQPPQQPPAEEASGGPQESLFDLVVKRLAGQGPPAHAIWLPPLDEPATLDEMLPGLAETPEYGFTTAGWDGRGRLHAAAGIVDRPFDQRRDPMWLDLSGAAGHVAVAGAPQSGKSTVLRTIVTSLALMHTPQEVQFYCLDFGGGTLAALADLPHVGGVASRLDPDRVRRTVAEVTTLLEQRERFFTERGIDSIATYRRMRAAGEIGGDGFGDVFLVVDNWLTVRQEFEQVETAITDVAARGLGYGIHVVAATNKWSEFRTTIRDLFGTRLELRLGDAYESEMDRKLAANVPEGRPGRGLTREGLHFLSALPRIDGVPQTDDLAAGVRNLVDTVRTAWRDRPGAPQVRMLPELLPASALPQAAETGRRIPIGIDEDNLAPVLLDFDNDPHFVVLGDNECGKSNLLRLVVESVKARYSLTEARLMILDYHRSLLDWAEGDHVIGYAASSTAATSLMNDTREALVNRLPPSDLTPEQLRNRSWWNGPELFLVVDDYDLVATPSGNPLAPLAELLPQARDIGMHLIVARSMGGAGRALFDPCLQRLKDMASPALIMSGSKDEGALFGNVRPQPLPVGRGTYVDRRTGTRLMQTAALTEH
ncbi:DNA segregation ATPase FtsK/SpoIIIE, S-DNA-T family [Thermomonospora echinospora]|uniref:DNA segregation ATPase FtsK/SpoIIIE, S-DNA-T family n=1 Tax=Thermomonospora echinospora TaxID=1992 RepID=A0A1H6D2Z2_9ACTN|nr:type VII secretion protein EccCa [Thermomonospora echinospora]SEG79348.1 DNA segregation ATPase FtsK/SpoIIIE, S-DNA-T family [Thermomonospora echinospora]